MSKKNIKNTSAFMTPSRDKCRKSMRQTSNSALFCVDGPEVGKYTPKYEISDKKQPHYSIEQAKRNTYLFLFAEKTNNKNMFDNDFD